MRSQPTDFTIGWICALEIERVVACELLDEEYEDDHSFYTYGRIKKHNLVIASLPQGRYGIASAARVAERMQSSFPGLQLLLMVGIAGGAPSSRHDIRLGDVVVSCPTPNHGGVIQYDYGKAIQTQQFEETGYLTPPSDIFLNAIAALRTLHKRRGHYISDTISGMLRKNRRLKPDCSPPDVSMDRLCRSDYVHLGQKLCDCSALTQDKEGVLQQHIIQRLTRSSEDDNPVIHYGLIASANQLIKDAILRDMLAHKHDVLCFETEAAGLMDGSLPCLAIRGISDYADSHKNDVWQGYAAATAAAYAKELLNVMPYLADILPHQRPDAGSNTKESCHSHMLLNSSDGVRFQVGGGVFSSSYLPTEDLDVRVYLEDIRNVFSGNAKETDERCINICVKLRKQADQIQAAIQVSRTGDEHTEQESQLFLNCVSRCTKLTPLEAVKRLSRTFSGSANYSFERSHSFYPEEYSLRLRFDDRIILMGTNESTRYDIRTVELHYYYATKPRQWRRVRVLATLEDGGELPMILPPRKRAHSQMFIGGLPKSILQLLEQIPQQFELSYRTTRLVVPMNWCSTGDLQYDCQMIKAQEDHEEIDFKDEFKALETLRASGCAEYQESQFIVLGRVQSYCFEVTDGKSNYMLHKARFSSDRQSGTNGFSSFLEHMMKFQKLSDCNGIPNFQGVILDDSMTYITGYLCELELGTLDKALAFAQSKDYTISRDLRKYWATQLIRAVQEVHAKGEFIGRVQACISQELNMSLHDCWGSIATLGDGDGRLPPELRGRRRDIFTQKSDMFQLGLVFWRLSEHISRSAHHFCTVAGCTIKPRYRCLETHSNPVSLTFSEGTDPVLQKIIEQCRQEDPDKRPTAEHLFQQIDRLSFDEAKLSQQKAAFHTNMKDFIEYRPGTRWCNECWALCLEGYYHCGICEDGDFDLCPSCIANGLHCWNETHQLTEIHVDSRGNMTEKPYVRTEA